MSITNKIKAYTLHTRKQSNPHDRHYSWEYCYGFFQNSWKRGGFRNKDVAALQLGFYLASWGMYRGSSFLLKNAYTVHDKVVHTLQKKHWQPLWSEEFGTRTSDLDLIDLVLELIKEIRQMYKEEARNIPKNQPSDTLITKILMGTVGCLPACDRYFVAGFKQEKNAFSRVNRNFISSVIEFSQENAVELKQVQRSIQMNDGFSYPIMKLVDMYFYHVGQDLDSKSDED